MEKKCHEEENRGYPPPSTGGRGRGEPPLEAPPFTGGRGRGQPPAALGRSRVHLPMVGRGRGGSAVRSHPGLTVLPLPSSLSPPAFPQLPVVRRLSADVERRERTLPAIPNFDDSEPAFDFDDSDVFDDSDYSDFDDDDDSGVSPNSPRPHPQREGGSDLEDAAKTWGPGMGAQRPSLAAEHAAAGNFDTDMRLLSRQLGICNFAPLKSQFIDRSHSFSQLDHKLKAGYEATTAEKFSDALRHFIAILHTIPLVVVETKQEVDQVKELIVIVKDYVLALQMELRRRELKDDDPVRQQELAAYITHCNLQIPHLRLALFNAMNACFKAHNLSTAANFARRLLETNPSNEYQARTARQVLMAAERNMKDATEINYDFRNPFVVCGATYVPIYGGHKDVTCPYCGTHFVTDQQGKVCVVCDLAAVGSDASGLLCSPSQVKDDFEE